MNGIMPYGNNFGFNTVPQMNPYQEKIDRYNNLQQQSPQQTSQQNTNMNFVVVENVEKARQQVVPFGCTIWMRDSNEPYQYVKSVNSIGSTEFHILKVEEISEIPSKQEQNANQYVSIEQYNKLNETVIQLQNAINYYSTILNQIQLPLQTETIKKEENKKVVKVNKSEKEGVLDA